MARLGIDTDPFSSIMADAMAAYGVDTSYAVAMARQARTIQNKRQVWALRLELREAERAATELCAETTAVEPFVCDNPSPCGTGGCRFVVGDLALLTAPALPGKSKRPTASLFEPTYTIESAIVPLQKMRTAEDLDE